MSITRDIPCKYSHNIVNTFMFYFQNMAGRIPPSQGYACHYNSDEKGQLRIDARLIHTCTMEILPLRVDFRSGWWPRLPVLPGNNFCSTSRLPQCHLSPDPRQGRLGWQRNRGPSMSNVLLIWRSNVVFQGSLLEAVESTVGSTIIVCTSPLTRSTYLFASLIEVLRVSG